MTDISNFDQFRATRGDVFSNTNSPSIEDAYWGFTLRNAQNAPAWVIGCQLLALLFGASFLAAALGLWLVPSAAIQSDTLTMRFGMSLVMAVLGYLLISYASRGTSVQLQFDQNLGEVREIVVNRYGKLTLLSQYGFDAFDDIAMTRHEDGTVILHLVRVDGGPSLRIAAGTEPQIGAIYARLDRDMLRRVTARRHEAVRPVFG